MNKGLRQLKKQLKFKKRLKQLGLKPGPKKNYNCYRTTGKPCSCSMCSGEHKVSHKKKKSAEKLKIDIKEYEKQNRV